MLFGKKHDTRSAVPPDMDTDDVLVPVRLPKRMYAVFQEIAAHQMRLGIGTEDLSVSDVLLKAATIYTNDYASKSDIILNDLALDTSPIVRLTNSILVHAINNSTLDFQIPRATEDSSEELSPRLFPSHLEPHIIRRLQMMTTPESGSILLEHNGTHYSAYVTYIRNSTGQATACIHIEQTES